MKWTGYNSVRSWAIAAACSFVMFIALLPVLISGILFVAFLDRFDTDRGTAALTLIISGVMKCVAGPFVGYLGGIFELRNLVVVGSCCAFLGMGVCFLAEDMITVTVSLGLIFGTGQTLVTCILPQILKQHFTKNIANANGVMFAGCGVGTFAIIPVVLFLLDTYGVSGGLLLTSGIMLHSVPVAMLLWDPKYSKKAELPIPEKELEADQSNSKSITNEHRNGSGKPGTENTPSSLYICNTNEYRGHSLEFINNKRIEADNNQLNSIRISNETDKRGTENISKSLYVSNANEFQGHSLEFTNNKRIEPENIQLKISKKDANTEIKHGKALDNVRRKSQHSNTPHEPNKYRRALKTISILGNPSFLVIMLCHSVFGYALMLVCTIIIDYSRDKDIPKTREHLFLMFIPVAQTVGHTCLGWVADKGYLSVAHSVAALSSCVGISCLVLVLSDSFSAMMVGVLGFGVFVAAIHSYFPGLVYECIEEEKHTMAIASRMMLFAPLSFTMSPMIGYFRGTLGSYDGALYLIIASTALCTILLLFLPCIARCTNRKI